MRRRPRAGPERVKSRRKTVAQKRGTLSNLSAAKHKAQSDVAQLIRERDEALEREKATGEVLRVISSSPGLHAAPCSLWGVGDKVRSWDYRHVPNSTRVLSHYVQLDVYHPALGHFQRLCRGSGYVDGASADEWATIVDPDHNRAPISQVCDSQARAEWECPVGRRQLLRIEFLSARCFRIMTVEAGDLP
jgi:hypothetical protein